MGMKKMHICILLWISAVSSLQDDYCERDENGSCKVKQDTCENEDEPCFLEEPKEEKPLPPGYDDFKTLSRLDGVKVGHVQEYLIDGVKMRLTTASLKPLAFEVPNAVTPDEIEHITSVATNSYRSGGLTQSIAKGGLTPEDTFKPSSEKGQAFGPAKEFINWDVNNDNQIDLEEVALFCRNYNFVYFKEEDVKIMIKVLELKEFDDGICDYEEFNDLNTFGIENYLNIIMREHPKWRQRVSDQTWLPMSKEFDPILNKMRERFGKLLKIPHRILLGSEHLQVVKYSPGGHYHAHHDSETERATHQPCCHHTNTKTVLQYAKCRLCRFITVLVYVNKPDEGGETAFPAADNITYADAAFRTRGKQAIDLYNLSEHCYDANLLISPGVGKAIIFYNHHVDSSGWLGKLDEWSLHGGCEVRKGEKWIFNMWLTAPYHYNKDEMSMYSIEYLEKTKEEQL